MMLIIAQTLIVDAAYKIKWFIFLYSAKYIVFKN